MAQLEELFDDIYRRYNRLRLEDMSPAFQTSYKQIIEDGTEMRADINATAAGLTAEISRASAAEGTLSNNLSITATGLTNEITRATAAEGTLSNTINTTATSMELTFKKIGASGYTASGITTITENGIKVTHTSVSNCYTEMTASGFQMKNSSNTVIGGLMNLNNEVVTAMQCLYNPTYSNLVIGVGPYSGKYTTGYGLQYKWAGTVYGSMGVENINNLRAFSIYSPMSFFLNSSNGMTIQVGTSFMEISGGQISFVWGNNTQRILTMDEIYEYMYGSD